MPDTQVERISQLDIGDGKLYEFAGANNGMVFNNVTEALAAIRAGTVANGDVFYIKNDGTSGYPVFIGTSAQITAADNAGKLLPGMLIYCTDDGVNDITALQVSYDNTTVKAKLDELGDTDISEIGDGTVTGAVSQVNSDLENYVEVASIISDGVKTYTQVLTELANLVPSGKFKKTSLIINTGSGILEYHLNSCGNSSGIYSTAGAGNVSNHPIINELAVIKTGESSTSHYYSVNSTTFADNSDNIPTANWTFSIVR